MRAKVPSGRVDATVSASRAAKSAGWLMINLAGIVSFALPFFLGIPRSGEASARAADAPWLLALLVPALVAVALVEASRGGLDAKGLALLGVLCAITAVMRLPISIAGANLMFFVPIVGGFVFGMRFGFLLGALGMAVSAAITGGIGPWLPFQMWASGWVGAGAGSLSALGDRVAPPVRIALLAVYGYAAGFFYGAVINLYFWPLVSVASDIGWRPGLGLAATLDHYRRFYLATSLAYDAFRGIGNAALIAIAGAPVVDLLRRYRRRFAVVMTEPVSRATQVPLASTSASPTRAGV